MPRALLGLLVLLAQVPIAAHPGHDPIAVSGTLVRVLPERIEVDTYDTTVMQRRTVSVVTDEYTRWRLGKKPVDPSELAAGTPVVVAFTHAELKDGTEGLVALEIRGREVEKEEVVKLLRQVFSLALITAFICFNTQSADLHVHAATDHGEVEHQHGPAVHHHDARVEAPGNEVRLTAVDADDTVILVRFTATSVSGATPLVTRLVDAAPVTLPAPTIVSGTPIVARAHGPPASRPSSPRAPPAS